jgi:hypothetical protein
MKRLLALATVLAIALAASAALGSTKPTKIKFTTWRVTTGDDKTATVAPRDTFKHCPSNPVMRFVVKGRMSHPSKKGVKFNVTWMSNGVVESHGDYKTKKKGRVKVTLAGGGAALADGKWQVFAIRQGQPLGKSTITVAGDQSACG